MGQYLIQKQHKTTDRAPKWAHYLVKTREKLVKGSCLKLTTMQTDWITKQEEMCSETIQQEYEHYFNSCCADSVSEV